NTGDRVGGMGITALSNGNYVIISPSWNTISFVASRGAVTWGNGSTGVRGTVSDTNSLVGLLRLPLPLTLGDQVGSGGVVALSNGNYVVLSPSWNLGQGAVTWGNGNTGVSGVVDFRDSLID